MGLLARLQKFQKSFSPQLAIPKIQSDIMAIGQGVDAPYLAFEIVQKALGGMNGIFLLPHGKKLFPCNLVPIDPAPQSPILLPNEQIASVKSTQILKTEKEIAQWHGCFPTATSPQSLVIVPCGFSGTAGLLIIHDSPILHCTDEIILVTCSVIASACQNLLQKQSFGESTNSAPIFSKQEFINNLQDKADAENALLISLPLDQFCRIITQLSPSACAQSIGETCLRVLSSIVQENGCVSSDGENLYAFFSDIGGLDAVLVSEQLQSSFQQAFSTPIPTLESAVISLADISQNNPQAS